MDILKIENFFYTRASSRIREKVKESGLKHVDIYKPDHKQISRIINNVRNKNNRFLICDAVISHFYKDETGKIIECGLLVTKKLGFTSIKEILWGTDLEISHYLYDLFKTLWDEITKSTSHYYIDADSYLCDYIPYAKYSTYYDLLFTSENEYPSFFYGIKEDTVIEELEPAKETALLYLYKRCNKQFSDAIFDFANTHLSFHKLDKTIKDELLPKFLSILEENKPDSSSLGLRVRDLIYADLSHCASMISIHKYDCYHSMLNTASSKYIQSLEEIQNLNRKDILM